MIESWGFELVKGLIKLFLNPLFYWFIVLLLITGFKRIKRERIFFGVKINNLFSEAKNTWLISIVLCIFISILSITIGVYLTFETVLILLVTSILLSITGSMKFLSAAYTLGITFILFSIIPLTDLSWLDVYGETAGFIGGHLTSIVILLGIFLFVEAMLIKANKHRDTFAEIYLGSRGHWIGQHQLKGMSILPFFAFIPVEKVGKIAPLFPVFELNDIHFSLIGIPFIIGYNFTVRGSVPIQIIDKLVRDLQILSVFVFVLAVVSIYYPFISLAAVVIAIVGRLFITYRLKLTDSLKIPYFRPLDKGIRVLTVIPNGPADRLGIKIGETIYKVNGQVVTDSNEFYLALQNSGAFFKLEVLDYNDEVRFITSAFYEEDHHELGLVFTENNYRTRSMSKNMSM